MHVLHLESFILPKKFKRVLIHSNSLSLGRATSMRISREGREFVPWAPGLYNSMQFCMQSPTCWAGLGQHREGPRMLWHADPQVCSCLRPQSLSGNGCGVCRVGFLPNLCFALASLPHLSPPGTNPWPQPLSNPTWAVLPEKGPQRGFAPSPSKHSKSVKRME